MSAEEQPLQASGYYDSKEDLYGLTVASGSLVVTLDFLKERDIRELLSCLSCMLGDDQEVTNE